MAAVICLTPARRSAKTCLRSLGLGWAGCGPSRSFHLIKAERWVTARWQWKPSCCPRQIPCSAAPLSQARSIASQGTPRQSSFCISSLMFGTVAHTEKLLRHGPALRELQHKEGNQPQTTHLMAEILLVRGAAAWLALGGELVEASREVTLSWVFLPDDSTWGRGCAEGHSRQRTQQVQRARGAFGGEW